MSYHIIAVIGANGRVGRAVVDMAISKGHSVVALDRTPQGTRTGSTQYLYKRVDAQDFVSLKHAITGCSALVLLSAAYNEHDLDGNITDDTPQHHIHNVNVCMSYNALCAAAELSINRVVLASSVNATGMLFSKKPQFDYLPLDELHPLRPEEAYSLSKLLGEAQADSIAHRYPQMRISSLRFHWVVPTELVDREYLNDYKGSWRDLWGWVSLTSAAQSVLASILVPESRFPSGHETFFIAAKTTCQQKSSLELVNEAYPDLTDIRGLNGNESLFDTSKAERLLDWREEGFPWSQR